MKMQENKFSIVLAIALLQFSLTVGQNTNIQNSPLQIDSILKQGPEYNFINLLVGNWQVTQTIYSIEGQKEMSQDTFKVESKMIGNFLQEVMQPIINSKINTFTRTTYLNYNRTNQRWEYVVLDTRYPLMMYETSSSPITLDGSITLNLDAFVVPPFWGMTYAGMLGRQRRVITFKRDTVTNEQYWTLPGRKEFLAIKYIFKRDNAGH
jgi:hypothetical protein